MFLVRPTRLPSAVCSGWLTRYASRKRRTAFGRAWSVLAWWIPRSWTAVQLRRVPPALEEAPRPTSSLVLPQLLELLLQNIGCVQPFVRGQQHLQALSSLEGKIALVR